MAFSPPFQRPFSATFDRRAAAAAAGNGLLNALIAYWPLNEAGGANNALDLHTNGLTLTQAESPGADTGKVYSTARTFDGSADYFTRNSEALLQTGDVDFTFAAWIYPTGSGVRLILSKDSGGNNRDYLIYRVNTSLFFSVWNSAGSIKEATVAGLSTDAWQLVTAWHDSTADTVNISINHGTAGSLATGGALRAVTVATFYVGAYGSSQAERWSGRIGPVAMWKSAAGGGVLSSSQRSALYAGGAGLAYAQFTI